MAQDRIPPAFQEYAANMMARFDYRTLSLAQRGLLYSMRLECWVNQYLPDSPEIIARMLGFDRDEIAAELPFVMPFFEVQNGRIFAPDLEAYRARVLGIRERQAQGGKAGAAKINARKTRANTGVSGKSGNSAGKLSGKSKVPRRVTDESFSLNPSLSPSQGEGGLGGVVGSGVSDFTLTPGWEVER